METTRATVRRPKGAAAWLSAARTRPWRLRRSPAQFVRLATVSVVPILVITVVLGRSHSAFEATTGNSGNNLVAGSVVLTDNDNGQALFSVSGMVPSDTSTKCVEVTYAGTLTPATPVRLYGGYVDSADANASADSGLAPYLSFKVEIGGAGTTCAAIGTPTTLFNGSLQPFVSTYPTYASGLSTGWTPAGQTGGASVTRPFRITMTLQDNNAAQGLNAEPALYWEVRSS